MSWEPPHNVNIPVGWPPGFAGELPNPRGRAAQLEQRARWCRENDRCWECGHRRVVHFRKSGPCGACDCEVFEEPPEAAPC